MKANNFYDSVAYVAEEIKRKALSLAPEKEIDELYETVGATWNFQITGEDITVWEDERISIDEDGEVTALYGVSVALQCDSDDFGYWAYVEAEDGDMYPVFYSDEKVCAVSSEQQGKIFGWMPKESEWESWGFTLMAPSDSVAITGGSIKEESEMSTTVVANKGSETISVEYLTPGSFAGWKVNGGDAIHNNPIELTREENADCTLEVTHPN